jgi:hypothetical protein
MPMNFDPDSASHNGSAITPSNDPMRVARQAIRSQVTAREYIERQLVQAQNAIEELRTKLRHVHHEREVAVAAAQSAIAARDTAERSTRAAESALTSERGNRVRMEGMLRNAETTIRDLREKLAAANQTLQVAKATERLNRHPADVGVIVEPEAKVATVREGASPSVRRPVGRPRKMVALVQLPPTMTAPLAVVPPAVFAVTPVSGRSVGRPRKLDGVEPISTLMTQPKNARASSEVIIKEAKPRQKLSNRGAGDQEPVQWWVEGWQSR